MIAPKMKLAVSTMGNRPTGSGYAATLYITSDYGGKNAVWTQVDTRGVLLSFNWQRGDWHAREIQAEGRIGPIQINDANYPHGTINKREALALPQGAPGVWLIPYSEELRSSNQIVDLAVHWAERVRINKRGSEHIVSLDGAIAGRFLNEWGAWRERDRMIIEKTATLLAGPQS